MTAEPCKRKSEGIWKCFVWGSVLSAALAGLTKPLCAQASSPAFEEGSLRITLRVYNYAHTGREVLGWSEREVARVFGEAGVNVEWMDCPLSLAESDKFPACQRPVTRTDFVLRILPRIMTDTFPGHGEALGFALPCPEDLRACVANIFYERIMDLTMVGEVRPYQALADAIAHEVGHLLLGPNSHSARGIMHAQLFWGELRVHVEPFLYFTPEQSGRLRAEVLARSRQEEVSNTRVLPSLQSAQEPSAEGVKGQQQGDLAGSLSAPAPPAMKPDLSVHIRVHNPARVQGALLSAAEEVAAGIFGEAGVKVEWHNCTLDGHNEGDPTCKGALSPEDVALRIVPRLKPAEGICSDATLGFTLGPLATVSYERVVDLAQYLRGAPFLILGRAMAHEIGHSLLRTTAHSPEGIMRAQWGRDELTVYSTSYMFFTPEQSRLLRAEVLARMGQRADSRISVHADPK